MLGVLCTFQGCIRSGKSNNRNVLALRPGVENLLGNSEVTHQQTIQAKLRQLLPDSDSESSEILKNPGSMSCVYYITPRNISPWSSKATSIAHVCGLKSGLQRIERGRVILLDWEDDGKPDADVLFKNVLYDRMTENFEKEAPDMNRMFAEEQPYPLEVIQLGGDDDQRLEVLEAYNKLRGLALDRPEMEYLVQACEYDAPTYIAPGALEIIHVGCYQVAC